MKFHKRLTELRRSKNLKQKDLANTLNIKLDDYIQYESGIKEPNFKDEEKIADYFNVTLDYLRGRTDTNIIYVKEPTKEELLKRELKKYPNFVRDINKNPKTLDKLAKIWEFKKKILSDDN